MFGIVFWIMISVWLLVIPFAIFMLYRNGKVYAFRVRLITEDRAQYKVLPSYDRMMWQFWRPMRSYERPDDD